MPKTTSAHGSGTRGSRRSRGSRSGLVIMIRPRRDAGVGPVRGPTPGERRVVRTGPLLLVLELALHRLGELVPGVDELLHALLLEHAEDVVEVHACVRDGLQDRGGVVVALLDGSARGTVV